MARNFTGFTCDTKNSLLLDAGVYFKNFNMETDDYDKAMAAGKCIGATQGGGSFAAVPTMRPIEIDGADPLQQIDGWAVTMTANIIESKPDTFKIALGTGIMTTYKENYYEIRAKRVINESDYIENITWMGSISGSNEPVIIQIFNSISTTGLTINTTPKSQSVLAVTFTASSDPCGRPEDAEFAPFRIMYPKSVAQIEIDTIYDTDTEITGTGITGAKVFISGGTIAETETTIDATKKFTVGITPQTSGTKIIGYQKVGAIKSQETIVYVETAPEDTGGTED